MDIRLGRNGHKPGMITRVRAWLLGVDPEKLEAFTTLIQGYQPPRGKHNSLILGGPTSWSWSATIDDTHHGSRGAGLHADSHARQHALDSADDHTGTITDTQHGSRGAGLHADSHSRQHNMDSASDHGAGTQGDLIYAAAGGAWTRRAIGTTGQVLTVVSGLPAWADSPGTAVHGNEKHSPHFYPIDGTEELTAPIWMQLMAVANEPEATAGNEGKLYYLTPNTGGKGIIKQIMKNSTGAFERVQISVST
jgi:hypothetical protein